MQCCPDLADFIEVMDLDEAWGEDNVDYRNECNHDVRDSDNSKPSLALSADRTILPYARELLGGPVAPKGRLLLLQPYVPSLRPTLEPVYQWRRGPALIPATWHLAMFFNIEPL